jgi:hypothetical protein
MLLTFSLLKLYLEDVHKTLSKCSNFQPYWDNGAWFT